MIESPSWLVSITNKIPRPVPDFNPFVNCTTPIAATAGARLKKHAVAGVQSLLKYPPPATRPKGIFLL